MSMFYDVDYWVNEYRKLEKQTNEEITYLRDELLKALSSSDLESTQLARILDLEYAIRAALEIKDLWLPSENEGEAQALAEMYKRFQSLVDKKS